MPKTSSEKGVTTPQPDDGCYDPLSGSFQGYAPKKAPSEKGEGPNEVVYDEISGNFTK